MDARPITLIAVAMIVLAASAAAEKPRVTREFVTELASRIGSRVERFSLWNDCGPMRFEAHLRSDNDKLPEGNPFFRFDVDLYGLSYFDVMSNVEDQLRAAHLLGEGSIATSLFVHVHVIGKRFWLDVSYSKPVRDLISGEKFFAATWQSQSMGEHKNDGNRILHRVTKEVDKFIGEYLRVNRNACEKRPPTR